jgi:hypothetical protein
MRNVRNAEGGIEGSSSSRAVGQQIRPRRGAVRIPHSALALSALMLPLSGCNPTTTRPEFLPLPLARAAQIFARPQQVIPALADLVAAESLRVRRASPRDGYLETEWYDTRTHRSFREGAAVPNLAHTVKLRCWADPYVPGETILTLEVAYRLRYDPSRSGRDFEMLVPGGQAGDTLADSLLTRLKRRFGSP